MGMLAAAEHVESGQVSNGHNGGEVVQEMEQDLEQMNGETMGKEVKHTESDSVNGMNGGQHDEHVANGLNGGRHESHDGHLVNEVTDNTDDTDNSENVAPVAMEERNMDRAQETEHNGQMTGQEAMGTMGTGKEALMGQMNTMSNKMSKEVCLNKMSTLDRSDRKEQKEEEEDIEHDPNVQLTASQEY